jgi:predicted negative regulator of RcsB-dependent stress response
MWSLIASFLTGNIWRILAGLVIATSIYAVWNAGADHEKAKVVKTVQRNVKVSNAIQNKNRKSSDSDVLKRLSKWQRD